MARHHPIHKHSFMYRMEDDSSRMIELATPAGLISVSAHVGAKSWSNDSLITHARLIHASTVTNGGWVL